MARLKEYEGRLEKAGSTPSFADGQIAAIARVNDCTLVTANPADFSRIKDLPLQDWRKVNFS